MLDGTDSHRAITNALPLKTLSVIQSEAMDRRTKSLAARPPLLHDWDITVQRP